MEPEALPPDYKSNIRRDVKMSKTSPMQRTLKWLRQHNAIYDIVESYNNFSQRRKDLFGVIDVVALFPITGGGYSLVGLQVCGTDWQPHMKKILASSKAKTWLTTNSELWLVGWRKLKSGWEPRLHKFKRGDFQTVSSHPPISKIPDLSNF